MELHVNWGHASAQQLKRALVAAEGNSMHLLTCVDEALGRREVCQSVGTSTVAVFSAKLQADLLFLGDIIALHVMNSFSENSLLSPVNAKNHQEVWDAFRSSWIGASGPPMWIEKDGDGDGEWKNELRTEL